MVLQYRTRRVNCPRCGMLVEQDAYEVDTGDFVARCVSEGAIPFPISRDEVDHAHCNWADPETYAN